ncbi:HalOD1 output domain-containing protein [Haloplanus natans]|uniref:HalOD1 output domain-containing protein n=1 Tax=Haloplanus natans TaxID=376171 RepID=UPI000677E209|nr:HalOD1 output domain-containing protein [Haloplanus natans]
MIDTAGVSWSEERGAYITRFDDEDGDYSPSVAVAEAVASALEDCERPLFDYVDPDALDALVAGSSETTVSFEVESTTVTVHGDGRVLVRI